MKNITIVGCGNTGLIHAFYFFKKGYSISILKTSSYNNGIYESIKKNHSFLVNYGNTKHKVNVKKITKKAHDIIPDADIILIATTTLQHELVAQKISPYLRDNQIICIMPSYASSYLFKKNSKRKLKFVEFETTLLNGRTTRDNEVNITFKNVRTAAYFEGFNLNEKKEFKRRIIDVDREAKNSFEIALHNPNLIVHTLGVLFSASRIEHSKGEFWMYKEAFTPSVLRVIKDFDREKNTILSKLGCSELNYFDAAKWRNESDLTKDSLQVFKEFSQSSNKGPTTLKHRYLLEDVPMGMVLFSSLGKYFNTETRIADSVITLTSSLLGTDFRKTGRTLSQLISEEDFII